MSKSYFAAGYWKSTYWASKYWDGGGGDYYYPTTGMHFVRQGLSEVDVRIEAKQGADALTVTYRDSVAATPSE